ncbi:MAG: PAS domain S-box protein [Pseudomonadota bacterium]
MIKTVKVPKEFEPIFERAEKYVKEFFSKRSDDPTKGIIEISDERYILVRAASMSVDFFGAVKDIYRDEGEEKATEIAKGMLFDIAHAIGKQDARNFHKKMNVTDPIEKLSAGPIQFAYSGWAFVDIFPESKPTPDKNYYLIYDHPYSFESSSWEREGKRAHSPVCIMNAGYSSGWCEESFGIPLVATEIMCKARGDEACRFIMAHPDKIEQYISNYIKTKPELSKQVVKYKIPGFFERKRLEEKLREETTRAQMYLDIAGVIIIAIDRNGIVTMINNKGCEVLEYNRDEIIGKNWFDNFLPAKDREAIKKVADSLFSGVIKFEHYQNPVLTKTGKEKIIAWHTSFLKDESGTVTSFLTSGEDITERVKIENDLKKHIFEMEIIYNSAMNREERILKLKNQITELEKELKKMKK